MRLLMRPSSWAPLAWSSGARRCHSFMRVVLLSLLALSFSLATSLEPWFQNWGGSRTQSANVIQVMLGDSRKLFAQQFYVKADAYLHSGYYPTIYDARPGSDKMHIAADALAGHEHE